MPQTYRRPRLRPNEREYLVAALIKYLVRPGLMKSCDLMLNQMELSKDIDVAKAIIALAKDLSIRGFPTRDERNAADELTDALLDARIRTALPELDDDDDDEFDESLDADVNRETPGSLEAEPGSPPETGGVGSGPSIGVPRP